MDGNDKRKTKWKLWVEILVTSVIIAVVWGLLSLPSVFYFLPRSSGSRVSQQVQQTSCTNYTKTKCLQVLTQSKSCFGIMQNSSNIMIAANVDQEANENTAQLIISGLPLLGATEMCTSSLIPFMCLYLFPLCDGNGTAHKPSRDQCIEISTVVCKDEWQKAALIPGVIEKLPDCESLSSNTSKVSEQIVPFNTLNTSALVNATCTQIQCADQFFCSSGTCLPQCGKWKQHDDKDSVALDAIIVISAVLALGCGIIVLILSCIWWKKMFVFPAVIVVYMNMTWITLSIFVLIAFTDRTTLFCSSQSVIEVVKKSTPYCSIIGAVYYYTLLQISIWWLCHMIIMFWNIRFPFHANKNLRTKPIHVTMVLLALLLPTIPVIVSFSTGGFVINSNPPALCVSRSSDAAYYSLVLPISIIIATGVSLLVLVIIIVIKHSNAKNHTSTAKIRFGTPEKKLLFLLCYYVIFGSQTLVTFAVDSTNSGAYIAAISHYFACEANGSSTRGRCDAERKAFESLNYVELYVMAYILLGLLPAVSLLYVVNFKKVKECICFNAKK